MALLLFLSIRNSWLLLLVVLLFNPSCGSDRRQFFNNRVVKFHEEPVNFFEAHLNCQEEHMELITIQEPLETKMLVLLMVKLSVNTTWLAATDLEGDWLWTSSREKVEWVSWGINQPNNQENKQHCLTLSIEHLGWNDERCSVASSYFCQEIPEKD